MGWWTLSNLNHPDGGLPPLQLDVSQTLSLLLRALVCSLQVFFMIRTRNRRIHKLDTLRPFKCPFRGCSRSFRNISARTQHIHAAHHDIEPLQDNSELDPSGDASRSPFNADQYPNSLPPHTPSTPVQINPPTRPAAEGIDLADPSQQYSYISPLHTPRSPTFINPTSSLYSPVESPSESVHSMDIYPVALNDEHYTAEDMRRVQSVAGPTESQEVPSPTFSSEETTALPRFPSATPHASTNRAESQSPQTLSVAQSSPSLSVMFTPIPAFSPRPQPCFFMPGVASTPASPLLTPSTSVLTIPILAPLYSSLGSSFESEALDDEDQMPTPGPFHFDSPGPRAQSDTGSNAGLDVGQGSSPHPLHPILQPHQVEHGHDQGYRNVELKKAFHPLINGAVPDFLLVWSTTIDELHINLQVCPAMKMAISCTPMLCLRRAHMLISKTGLRSKIDWTLRLRNLYTSGTRCLLLKLMFYSICGQPHYSNMEAAAGAAHLKITRMYMIQSIRSRLVTSLGRHLV
jgi:hypothetical protein